MTNLVFLVVASLALAFALWLTWMRWTPCVRYRARRYYRQMTEIVRRYLVDEYSLETAATRMASLWRHPPNVGDYQPDFPPFERIEPGSGSLIPLSYIITPSGYSPEDPRIARLVEAISIATLGRERYDEIQRDLRDRILRARQASGESAGPSAGPEPPPN